MNSKIVVLAGDVFDQKLWTVAAGTSSCRKEMRAYI